MSDPRVVSVWAVEQVTTVEEGTDGTAVGPRVLLRLEDDDVSDEWLLPGWAAVELAVALYQTGVTDR